MAGDSKKIDRLLEFARNNGEAEFQTNTAYKNLKAKPKLNIDITLKLIRGLKDMYFAEDCVYWCEKINGKCKREDQYFVLTTLIVSYHMLGRNHDLVLKVTNFCLVMMQNLIQNNRHH